MFFDVDELQYYEDHLFTTIRTLFWL